jgi:hypothetical protein
MPILEGDSQKMGNSKQAKHSARRSDISFHRASLVRLENKCAQTIEFTGRAVISDNFDSTE